MKDEPVFLQGYNRKWVLLSAQIYWATSFQQRLLAAIIKERNNQKAFISERNSGIYDYYNVEMHERLQIAFKRFEFVYECFSDEFVCTNNLHRLYIPVHFLQKESIRQK